MKYTATHIVRASLAGLGIFILLRLLSVLFAGESLLGTGVPFQLFYTMAYTYSLYFVNAYIITGFLKKYGRNIFEASRLIRAIGSSLMISFLVIFAIRAFHALAIRQLDYREFLNGETAGHYWPPLLLALIILCAFYGVYYYRLKNDKQVETQRVIAGEATAKFDALKNQLDPHFLFNSLNVLSSLIEENPKAALTFTSALSKVYRYVLEQKNKELVTVDEELDFARLYFSLLKMRFEEGIRMDIPERSSDPELKVVPLSLQLLLENAVKHNSVDKNRPLNIVIRESEGFLEVRNNLQTREVLSQGSGVGLRNIRQRYALLTNREIQILRSDDQFTVWLPMLRKQVASTRILQDSLYEKRYQRAKKRLEALKAFYGNLTAYLLIIPALAWLNFRTSEFPWIIFPAFGWGLGLLFNGLEVYGYPTPWGKRWEEKKIKELIDKETR